MKKQKKLLIKQEEIAVVANDDQLEDRLSFEAMFAAVLLRLMNRQANAARNFFAKNGFLPSEEEFKEEMQSELFSEYMKIMNFSINNFNIQQINEFAEAEVITDQSINEFKEDMAFSLLMQSEAQANEITSTTFKQYNEQLVKAQEEAMTQAEEEDVPFAGVTTVFLADQMNSKVKELNIARSELIAINEMTRVSEDVKFNFALNIQRRLTAAGIPVNMVKRWQTTMDGRARDAHMAANGQVRNILDAFIVGGQMFNYPGDMSLGASVSNFIRCRCWAVYEIRS